MVFTENKWFLISSKSSSKMKDLLINMYPNSVILYDYDKIWYVDNGWDKQYPYLGQTSNPNWSVVDENDDINPYFGYWMKTNSIFNLSFLPNSILNINDILNHENNVKYALSQKTYFFQSVDESFAFYINYENITYSANSVKTINNNSYYFGNVQVTITSEFNNFVSLYTENNSATDLFIYRQEDIPELVNNSYTIVIHNYTDSNHYNISGEDRNGFIINKSDPNLYFFEGDHVTFIKTFSGHNFDFNNQEIILGENTSYSTILTNGIYEYKCTSHTNMSNKIYVSNLYGVYPS